MPKAPAPSKSSFKLTVHFGLVPVQFAAYKMTEEGGVKRKMHGPSGSPVAYQVTDTGSGEVISRDQVTMMYEIADGTMVPLDDGEIVKAAGFEEITGTEVVGIFDVLSLKYRFVPDEVYMTRAADKHNIKTYELMMYALGATGEGVLLRFVVRGRERLAILYPSGELITVHFEDEVREAPKPSTPAKLTEAERKMAVQLISHLGQSWEGLHELPEQSAQITARVEEYASKKAKGLEQTTSASQTEETLTDLMAMLTASVQKAKTSV